MERSLCLIHGAQRVDAIPPVPVDLLIENQTIAEIGPAGSLPAPPGATVVDATGLWLLPGAVDPHVHFGMPLRDGIASRGWRDSSAAALLGGTTTVVDFANPDRDEPLPSAVARWRDAADRDCLCDYGLHVTIASAAPSRLDEVAGLVSGGMPTLKAFLAYKDRLMLAPDEMRRVMTTVRDAGGRLLIHAEDGELNAGLERRLLDTGRIGPGWHPAAHPPESEAQAIETALALAAETGCPLTIVHLSTAEGVASIRRARAAGRDVRTEVTIQHLLLTGHWYKAGFDQALAAIMSPPLRTAADNAALLEGLRDGTIGWITTDHCEFPLEVKRQAAAAGFPAVPNGAAGVGERLLVTYTELVVPGHLSPADWVRLCCEEPARSAGLDDRKGRLAPGLDADLVLFDPDATGTRLPFNADHSLWAGDRWRGAVRHVWRRGEQVVRDGWLMEGIGPGRFLERSLHR